MHNAIIPVYAISHSFHWHTYIIFFGDIYEPCFSRSVTEANCLGHIFRRRSEQLSGQPSRGSAAKRIRGQEDSSGPNLLPPLSHRGHHLARPQGPQGPPPGHQPQVWSLTQLYSVDFSKSRIGVKKCVLNERTIKVCVSCY